VKNVDLNLSEELADFVNEQVEVGKFAGANAYIEHVLIKNRLSVVFRVP
jgi:Arc/MetJ-type ribon-helix-helix transcriptional regulator